MNDNHIKLSFLRQLKGFGPVKINKEYLHIVQDYDIEGLCEYVADHEYRLSDSVIEAAKNDALCLDEEINNDKTISVITALDNDYPSVLSCMGNSKPVILYMRGSVENINKKGIAVVGTRSPSERTLNAGPKIVQTIIDNSDYSIISGLAIGCDTIAHRSAVDNSRCTVAVLPSGLNAITPASNKSLANEILQKNGCLISEYAPNERAQKSFFVRRDTIIAALSDGIVALECGIKSGTMHTIDDGHAMKKPIGCFYPKDAEPSFDGCKLIIEKACGCCITTPNDIKVFINRCINEKQSEHDTQMSLFNKSEFKS